MSLYCSGRYSSSIVVLCARLSTSSLAPFSPSGLSDRTSFFSVELARMALASPHAPSSPISQCSSRNSVRLCVFSRSSAVEETQTHSPDSNNIMTSVYCVGTYTVWKVSVLTQSGKCRYLHSLESVGTYTVWKVSVLTQSGKCPYLHSLESVRTYTVWKVSVLTQSGKCRYLHSLEKLHTYINICALWNSGIVN